MQRLPWPGPRTRSQGRSAIWPARRALIGTRPAVGSGHVTARESAMRSTPETFDTPLPLSACRATAKARGRRTEYIARAYRCCDLAVRARNAEDAQFLRAMTLVWKALAETDADVHNAA